MEPTGLMQIQLRQNNDELLDYLKGLDSWEEEMKEKDQRLLKNKSILKESLPPVQSSTTQQKPKRKKKEIPAAAAAGDGKSHRICSYDYKAWDKFDADKACEQVDYEIQSSSESEEVEEEGEEGEGGEERQRLMAIAKKEKGNVLYKEGKYESAVECYSHGMLLDPLSAALPANRALALLKLERFAAVEVDCNTALALDEHYVKAYLRRGVARRHLGKYSEAIQDFEHVLKLEPTNKQGAAELTIAQRMKEDEERKKLMSEGHVFPVKRAVHLRSKRPLKRILIDDITGQVNSTESDIPNTTPLDSQEVTTSQEDQHIHEQATCTCTIKADAIKCPSKSDQENVMDTSEPAVSGSPDESNIPTTRSGDDCELPPPPKTSFEFQSHWKQLWSSRPILMTYFRRIEPSTYPVLLQQSLETDIFSDIISILRDDNGTRSASSCIDQLTWLTRVPRFSVALMFLSKKDKSNIKSAFADLLSTCKGDDSDISTVKTLATKYGLTLHV